MVSDSTIEMPRRRLIIIFTGNSDNSSDDSIYDIDSISTISAGNVITSNGKDSIDRDTSNQALSSFISI